MIQHLNHRVLISLQTKILKLCIISLQRHRHSKGTPVTEGTVVTVIQPHLRLLLKAGSLATVRKAISLHMVKKVINLEDMVVCHHLLLHQVRDGMEHPLNKDMAVPLHLVDRANGVLPDRGMDPLEDMGKVAGGDELYRDLRRQAL